jgi:hypothetical protein
MSIYSSSSTRDSAAVRSPLLVGPLPPPLAPPVLVLVLVLVLMDRLS